MALSRSSIIQQAMNTNGLKSNHKDKEIIGKFGSKTNFEQAQCQFELDGDIRKTREEPLFQGFGKSIYEVEWINRNDPPIILLKIDGVKAKKEASFYVELSSHPHIVHTYGLVQSNPESIMILQERAPQNDLSELLRQNEFKPSERVLWSIFEQICDAMIFLVDKSIIHGDLACRNVLLFQMNPVNPKKNLVKLTDFGLTTDSQLYSVVDNPALATMTTIRTRYAAPELIKNPKKLDYSEKSDVYSMSTLMWEARSYGELPYSDIKDNETIRRQKMKDEKLPRPALCSDDLWTIINQCWEWKPQKRPTFQSLKQSISNLQSKSIVKSEWEGINNASSDPSIMASQSNKDDNLGNGSYENCTEQDDDIEILKRNYDQYYSYAESDDFHAKTNLEKESSSCPFCQEYFPSSIHIHDHLVQCGTKTDQCPNCRQFIQRAIFAYHYENNCADINESEISDGLNNSSSNDISLNSPYNSNKITQSTIFNIHNSSEIVECQFCHNQCAKSDYQIHKDYCLHNPVKRNNSRPRRSVQSRIDKRHCSNEFVVIPCKYCQEQCSAGELSSHEILCSKKANGLISSKESIQNRSRASQSAYSSASPKTGRDATPLLSNEALDIPDRNPQSSSTNEQTDKNPNECCCCCCS